MGMETCFYSVLDVAEHLQSKFAFISGTKAKNSAPVMTFPDRPNIPEPSEEDYRKVVTYLCNIPPLVETQMGFVLLVDRRQSGWGSVKTILKRFSNFFPCQIQVVFLLQPHGFFQRAFSDYKSKFKEELQYKVISMTTPEELFEYIDPSFVTTDMGGTLVFDTNEWTQNRLIVEKFSSNTEKTALSLTTLVQIFENSSTPNDVANTEKQISEHTSQRKELLDNLDSLLKCGQTLLSCIKGENERTPLIKLAHVLEIERLILQLEETSKQFEDYWEKYRQKLNQTLQLRKFEEEFKTFQYNCESKMNLLESKMKEIGGSVPKVEELIQEFNEFEETAKQEIEQGEKMRENGEHYISDDHYAVDSIRPKCIELQRMCEQYRQLLRRRRETLTKSQELQEGIDKANKWCVAGFDMLTNQKLQGYGATTNGVVKAVEDIDHFITTVKNLPIEFNNPKEFRQLFCNIMTSDTMATVQKTLKKIDHVQSLCAMRKADLLAQTQTQLIQHPVQPDIVTSSSTGQTTVPEYHLQKKHRGHRTRDKRTNKEKDLEGKHIDVEKSARMRVEIGPPQPQGTTLGSTHMCCSMSTLDSADGAHSSLASSSTASGPSSLSDQVLDSCLYDKRKHVLSELIQTERVYVEQLKDIIEGYYKEMDSRTMQHLIPKELINKKDILFGNLEQIYRFHNDVFLKDLQSCEECPAKLGKCFVKRKEEFQMYSIYCQNKPRSEELQGHIGDNNPFFKECQYKLKHKLPLGAFLLKPVQQITKYQLLLKEMLKYTKDDKTCRHQLEEALSTMLEVVRIVNNSMYEVSIVGFRGLSELGKLLMQGNFNVWTEHKHEKIRDIRFKPMQRHLFLYEKAILMCKDTYNGDRDVFSFKNILRCNQVGLTENIKGDKKKFELWLRGREEVYIVQAPSMDVKEFWVKEIKKVLMSQFDAIKLDKLNIHQHSSEDLTKSCSDSGSESWRHRQGSGNSNTSTVLVGLTMMSPESPPKSQEGDRCSDVEYTDSEPEDNRLPSHYVSPIEPSYLQQFVVIADYCPVDHMEMGLQEGDIVEILRTGSTGWWLAHHLNTNEEGWVPSTYLDPIPNTGSDSKPSQSSLTSGDSVTTSVVDESTV